MTYSQIFTEKQEYLLAITDGDVADVESFIVWASAVLAKAKEMGKSKILFDNRTFKLHLSPPEVLAFAEQIFEMGVAESGFRVAVISCPANSETSRLVEQAFANTGGGFMRFNNQHEAQDWLYI